MEINWEAEIKKNIDGYVDDLTGLLEIDSSRDVEHGTDEFPLGPGPAKALNKFLSYGERDGFKATNVENVAGRLEIGQGNEILGILGHMDVVPAGEGWKTDPFKPEIKGNLIYARGASDDKGPTLAAYYALKTIKNMDLPLSKQVHFIVGTDEESDWYGMNRYIATQPSPDIAFSPDAEFPIINGEKGIVSYEVKFNPEPNNTDTDYTLSSFNSGLRTNMVPQSSKATLVASNEEDYAELESKYREFLGKNKLSGEINHGEISLTGRGSHAQEPRDGRNAGTYLAVFLDSLNLDDAGSEYVDTIARFFHEDSRGKLTKINTTDEVMGELTASPDIFEYDQNGTKTVVVNVRYPQNITAEEVRDNMQNVLSGAYDDITTSIMGEPEVPHYVSGDDPLVKTLLSIYGEQTGLPAHEQVIGGGTYGRMFKRGVAFGALFPDEENVMHQPNEYANIDNLIKAAAIYAEAIYELAK